MRSIYANNLKHCWCNPEARMIRWNVRKLRRSNPCTVEETVSHEDRLPVGHIHHTPAKEKVFKCFSISFRVSELRVKTSPKKWGNIWKHMEASIDQGQENAYEEQGAKPIQTVPLYENRYLSMQLYTYYVHDHIRCARKNTSVHNIVW